MPDLVVRSGNINHNVKIVSFPSQFRQASFEGICGIGKQDAILRPLGSGKAGLYR